jgi:hypothetical protein
MGSRILCVLLAIFLAGVFNTIYSVFIMFFTVFLLGWKGELFETIQSGVIGVLAIATSVALTYKIWPRHASAAAPENVPEASQTD